MSPAPKAEVRDAEVLMTILEQLGAMETESEWSAFVDSLTKGKDVSKTESPESAEPVESTPAEQGQTRDLVGTGPYTTPESEHCLDLSAC